MRLRQQLLVKNACYIGGRTITPKGVMVHSTGANNPKVSRYVPGDSEMGCSGQPRWNAYHAGGKDIGPHDFIKDPKTGHCKTCGGDQKCVHAFIGKFADGGVGTVQTLPWNRRGWHAGGSANNTHIGFEICEDGLADPGYFGKVYQEATEFTAMLCKEFNLDPLKDGVVICHQEGYRRGVASNHGDVLHWFPKQGKTMDDFRADVAGLLRDSQSPEPEKPEGGDEEMTYEQWKEYMERYRRELGSKDPAPWAVPYIDKCVDAGIVTSVNGTMERPGDLLTRQEGAKMAAQTLEAAKKWLRESPLK